MVVYFTELSQAVDRFNENRIESEHITYAETIKSLNDPLDRVEVLELIVELLLEG